MNRFDNLSAAQIADLIGNVDAQAKALDAEKKALRAALEARNLDADTVCGDQFAVSFNLRNGSLSLDKDAVEKALGKDWVAANSKQGAASVVMTIKAVNAAVKAA
jgi:hypothetical protein